MVPAGLKSYHESIVESLPTVQKVLTGGIISMPCPTVSLNFAIVFTKKLESAYSYIIFGVE